jgi:hypothetical protein
MLRIAVTREDGHVVTAILQADRGIDDEPFGAADAEIRVEEDHPLYGYYLWFCHGWRSIMDM